MTTSPDYDGPVYVGPEQDEPELVDADVDEGPVPAAGEREDWREQLASAMLEHVGNYAGVNSDRAEAARFIREWQPAVPVGVHPEPAEERRCSGCNARIYPGFRHFAGCPRLPAVSEPQWQPMSPEQFAREVEGMRAVLEGPAVPVVHPEPGDRAEQEALRVFIDLYYDDEPAAFELARARQAVAAAVVAVRADLAAQIHQKETGPGSEHWRAGYECGRDDAAALVRGPAAAVRSATKEGLG